MKPSNHYINSAEFRAEVVACQQAGKASEKLWSMFILLANRLANGFRYEDPMDREDAVNNAIMILGERYMKFDPNRPCDCFSYFTQIALNGLREGWTICAGHKKFTSSIDSVFEESI